MFLVSDRLCFNLCVCVFQREEESARRRAIKEKKKKEREESLEESKQPVADEEEEEEEKDLPPIYIPDTPSPLYCGFYSLPGQFWLSMVHKQTHGHFWSIYSYVLSITTVIE